MGFEVRGVTPYFGVYDMPASVRFYRDLLGFEIVDHSPILENGLFHWGLLRLGKAYVMLNTNYEFDEARPVPPDQARDAAHRDTCLYFDCPDVEAAYAEFRAKGVEVKEPKVAPYGMKQMYLVDPDGYFLCFQCRVNASPVS